MFQLIKTDKYDKLVESLLYKVYFVYQFTFLWHVSYLDYTVKVFDMFTSIIIIISFATILLIDLYYFLRGKYDLKEIAIYFVIGLFLLVSLFNYRDVMVMVNIFTIMVFKNVDVKKALKVYLYATILGMIGVFIFGILTPYTLNVVQSRYGAERVRYGLGFYYTSFPLHYLLSVLLVFFVVCDEVKAYHYIIFSVLNIVLFLLTDTKAPFAFICMALILHFILTKFKSEIFIKIFGFLTILSYPVLTLCTIFMSVYYDPNNKVFFILNRILTGRLQLTHKALEVCGFKFFGQTVSIWGEGFYIDSSIVNMLVLNGLSVLILSVGFMTYFSYISVKTKNIPMMIALSFFALRSTFDWGFMAFQMTPIVIMFYTVLNDYKNMINNKVENNCK